ncbi:MAG: hypothetical protein BGO51_28330 [Rhodospirillales bacterium 69-11]|nr:MAG: hypothetical protein BGO51_28330 [Rhodospirillales bacterium 69-11]
MDGAGGRQTAPHDDNRRRWGRRRRAGWHGASLGWLAGGTGLQIGLGLLALLRRNHARHRAVQGRPVAAPSHRLQVAVPANPAAQDRSEQRRWTVAAREQFRPDPKRQHTIRTKGEREIGAEPGQ